MLNIGTIFQNRYEILEVLGKGSSGVVYKVRQVDAQRIIALKVLDCLERLPANDAERFHREAKALSLLQHENIVTFYHFGLTEDAVPFVALEYLQGQNLGSILKTELHLSPERAGKIAQQICEALSYSHEHGIIHRDLKPENIFLLDLPEPDYVKVVDFGLAKFVYGNDSAKLTKSGTLLGSIHYMSPEQARGKAAILQSDIYSLGCILFEMLTGQKPFVGDNSVKVIFKHLKENPPRFSDTRFGKDCCPEFEVVCQRAMDKDPQNRYQTMAELSHDIEIAAAKQAEFAQTQANGGRKLSQTDRSWKSNLPLKVAALLIVCVLTTSATAMIWKWKQHNLKSIPVSKPSSFSLKSHNELLYKKALALSEKAFGPNDPRVADKITDLANFYRLEGMPEKAEPYFSRAYVIRTKVLGPDHPDTISSLRNLAGEMELRNHNEEAIQLLRKALTSLEKTSSANDLVLYDTLIDLSKNLLELHNYKEAELYARRGLAIREKEVGRDDHPALADGLFSLARSLEAQGQFVESGPILKRYLSASKTISAKDDSFEAQLYNVGSKLNSIHNYKEAEPFLLQSLAIQETAPHHSDALKARTLRGLADVYRSRGQTTEAEKLEKQAAALSI